MKKIFYFIASAIVALGAVACQNDIDETIDNNQQTEGLSIKVTIDEQTRVELGQLEDNKRKLTFTEGDVLVARANRQSGTSYLFECTKTEGDVYTFTCTAEGVSSLVGTKPWFFYLGGLHEQADELTIYGSLCNTAAEDLSGIGLSATSYDFDHNNKNLGEEGHMVSLHALPLLKFTANEPVTFKSTNPSQFFVNGWADSYTTKKTGEIYLPIMTSGGECAVTVTTESGFNKTFTKMFEENKIYNLGEIKKEESEWAVVGSFQGWDVAKGKAITMYKAANGEVFAKGIELYKDDEFKFVKNNVWDGSLGFGAPAVATVDVDNTLNGDQNVKAQKNGVYDFYLNPEAKTFKYECVEEYTDLKVIITIDNKANWSPLYIVLKDGDTFITAESGDLVSDGKYEISGEHIGKDLSYQFISGDKKSEEGTKVTISHNGATITFEENTIKFIFKLDTANAKQWWGKTTKMHVWNSGTTFDTSWPGHTMIYDGDCTWHINIPSELVGKTMSYKFHNGNGWESSNTNDYKVVAQDKTITGSSVDVK